MGVVAGGPYDCANGSVYRALRVCMNGFLGEPDAEDALKEMRTLAAEGGIDALAHLTGDRVYLFHDEADDTVARAAVATDLVLVPFTGRLEGVVCSRV